MRGQVLGKGRVEFQGTADHRALHPERRNRAGDAASWQAVTLALGCQQGWQTVPNAGFIAALNRGGPLLLVFGVLGRSGTLARLGDACVPRKIGAV